MGNLPIRAARIFQFWLQKSSTDQRNQLIKVYEKRIIKMKDVNNWDPIDSERNETSV